MSLTDLFGSSDYPTRIDGVDRRLDQSIPQKERLDSVWSAIESRDSTTGEMNRDAARRLYNLVRGLRASLVVETGVAAGSSTAHILQALADRGGGELISIDYPFVDGGDIKSHRNRTYGAFGGASVPEAQGSGYAVPDTLRQSENWTLIEGRSQTQLVDVLADVGTQSLDLFVHDSEHSLPAMLFEMEAAWPRLREGGVLIVDDLSWTDAWEEWVSERQHSIRESGRLADDVGYAVRGDSDA